MLTQNESISTLNGVKESQEKELQEMRRVIEEHKVSLSHLEENGLKKDEANAALNSELEAARQQASDMEEKLKSSQLTLTADSDAAKEASKNDYEAKLSEAVDKQNKAIEVVKKMKAAASAKLQSIENE